MSGRDLRSFVTTHHVADAERMVRRAREGVKCSNYRQMDYERLQSEISQRKLAGQAALLKLKCIKAASRQQKEDSLGKQHCIVWQHELARLGGLRKHLESELSMMLLSLTDSDDNQLKQIFQDFSSFESLLADDFFNFKENTTDVVWSLRSDLQDWMHAQTDGELNTSVELDEPEMVLQTIASVKEQQSRVMDQLLAVQQQLEADLQIGGLFDSSISAGNRSVQSGIPEEAFNLQCPDLELKTSVLQHFIFLDGRYVERLNQLEEDYCTVLNLPTGGWSTDDHDTFLYVMESYTYDLANRRLLYIDCLQRCLPHKARSDIVEHEEWWNQRKFYYQRRRDLIVDWLRDRAELLNRVKNVFHEACMSRQLEDSKLEDRQKQKELCDTLYAKVHEWRVQKMEAFQLEQQLANAARLNSRQARMVREEKEKMHREQQKAKISQFREKQTQKREEQEQKDRKRLEELQKFLQEQAAYDLERVKFREHESQKKVVEKERRKEEMKQAEEEKERILEAIRQTVRPHVEGDLLRLWSDTAAWQARQKPEEFLNIQQPLFDINTFTSNQGLRDVAGRHWKRISHDLMATRGGSNTCDWAYVT